MLEAQDLVARALNVFGDFVAVGRPEDEGPQNQHVERALQQLGPLAVRGQRHGSHSTLTRVDALP